MRPEIQTSLSRHSMNLVRALVLAFIALGGAGAHGRAAGLDGIWRIDVPKKWGVTLHTYLILRHDGEKLDGSVVVNDSNRIPIRNPHEESGDSVFGMDWGWTFRVRTAGQNLHVVITYGSSGRDETTAVPASESEFAPPPTLPLPELRELPSNGLARTPPMGWNSWNHFAESVDDKIVREAADAMVASGMAAAGYAYINIDDTGRRRAMRPAPSCATASFRTWPPSPPTSIRRG